MRSIEARGRPIDEACDTGWYPGWHARQAKKSMAIYQRKHNMRGAGASTIYQPKHNTGAVLGH